jgi:hypothetical protein
MSLLQLDYIIEGIWNALIFHLVLIYVRLFEVDGRTGHQLSNCVAIYSENQLHFDALVITLSVITGLRIFHDYLPKRGCMSW